jgi:hemerythrin-like metal-binding protein
MKVKLNVARSMFQINSPVLVEWREKYRTGIPAIDYQHREFIRLTNEIYESCLTGDRESQSVFLKAMRKMVQFVYRHFAVEEGILEQAEFPLLACHKMQHGRLVKEILETVKSYEEGKRYIPNRFARLLKDWVQDHIGVADNAYMVYIRSRERKGLLDVGRLPGDGGQSPARERGGGAVDPYRHHRLADILLLCVVAMVRGVENLEDVYFFGLTHLVWLRRYLALPNGIPRTEMMRRTLGALEADRFAGAFKVWTKGYFREPLSAEGGEPAENNGAAANRGLTGPRKALREVNVWTGDDSLILGQVHGGGERDETGEYTAIPALLDMLDLSGRIVTIDAHEYSKSIVHTIVSRGGDYILFISASLPDVFGEINKMYTLRPRTRLKPGFSGGGEEGGEEGRQTVWLQNDFSRFLHRDRWPGLKNVGCMLEMWMIVGAPVNEKKFFLTSLSDTDQIIGAARTIGGVENRMHWTVSLTRKDEGGGRAAPSDPSKREAFPAAAQGADRVSKAGGQDQPVPQNSPGAAKGAASPGRASDEGGSPARQGEKTDGGNEGSNLSALGEFAASLIEAEGDKKFLGQELTPARKRLYAAWSTDYLLKILSNL